MSIKKDLQAAKDACYRLLKVRARSTKELRDRLKVKGFENTVIENVLACLAEIGLIDDCAFARWWVESRIERPLGFHRLAAELRIKGVNKDIISEVLREHRNAQHETAIVRQLLEAKKKHYRGCDKKKLKQRLWGFFLRRGFSKEIVFDVLNEL